MLCVLFALWALVNWIVTGNGFSTMLLVAASGVSGTMGL